MARGLDPTSRTRGLEDTTCSYKTPGQQAVSRLVASLDELLHPEMTKLGLDRRRAEDVKVTNHGFNVINSHFGGQTNISKGNRL